ncbi:MAG TPA: hypothetical protein ENK66_11350 [Arcobacter sp.]|jgi:hypothetical protein|nr:hypothetical protein [Arcobacter sp.]
MEITEINNSYINNSTDVSTLSSSVNLKALENAKSVQLDSSSFTLDIDTSFRRSDFATTLKESLNQLAVNQSNIQQVNQQREILSSIHNAAQSLLSSENFEITQNEVQPQIESSIQTYNSISANLSKNFAEYQEDTTSRGYFDGILGAKPLSPGDIIKAIEEQQKFLDMSSNKAQENVQEITTRAKQTIGAEIEKAAARAPYEPVDFGKNTSDFTSTNINSIVGSVISAQANAIPAHSQKLLS